MRRREFVAFASAALAAGTTLAQGRERTVRVGFLVHSANLRNPFWKPFFAAMSRLGWREGVDYSIEIRDARGDPARALALARELAAQPVDLIVAISGGAALAASKATRRIPVVSWLGYPVEAGLAKSLAHPGGNVTGVANYAGTDVWAKSIELLRELRPGLGVLGVLWDYGPPAFPDGHVPIPIIEQAAQRIGIKAHIWTVRTEEDLKKALSALERERVEAIIITNGGGIHLQLADKIGETFARLRLPAIVDVSGTPVFERGRCVLAYGPNVPEILTRLASFVDRICRSNSRQDSTSWSIFRPRAR